MSSRWVAELICGGEGCHETPRLEIPKAVLRSSFLQHLQQLVDADGAALHASGLRPGSGVAVGGDAGGALRACRGALFLLLAPRICSRASDGAGRGAAAICDEHAGLPGDPRTGRTSPRNDEGLASGPRGG